MAVKQKIEEMRNLAKEELHLKLKAFKEELFKLNAQRYSGRVEKPHMISSVKRNIARVMTLLNEKKE